MGNGDWAQSPIPKSYILFNIFFIIIYIILLTINIKIYLLTYKKNVSS